MLVNQNYVEIPHHCSHAPILQKSLTWKKSSCISIKTLSTECGEEKNSINMPSSCFNYRISKLFNLSIDPRSHTQLKARHLLCTAPDSRKSSCKNRKNMWHRTLQDFLVNSKTMIFLLKWKSNMKWKRNGWKILSMSRVHHTHMSTQSY